MQVCFDMTGGIHISRVPSFSSLTYNEVFPQTMYGFYQSLSYAGFRQLDEFIKTRLAPKSQLVVVADWKLRIVAETAIRVTGFVDVTPRVTHYALVAWGRTKLSF